MTWLLICIHITLSGAPERIEIAAYSTKQECLIDAKKLSNSYNTYICGEKK